ncbi:enoyl-CoA hydratase/isomerase family protein [Aestuariibaculum suncheonense]|uniref:Enoyl-CoA hydratase/isomerase family protein n=1 Tax=Aestuariibaculum suncheonense TaxID=1028745 RepID=A0A8J6Q7H7_9FLAO|nr:enoyl-CoA hydratase/isomerase family protein [Aestuariibaculum suncheonense]MBD0836003.1 enoyl-CoA hydratase/isomerase family protein [Aestuariibaculum suncheonense]
MNQAYVTLEVKNKVGYIEFYHPQHNAMPSEVLLQLEDTIVKAGTDERIAVLVLKSGGDRTFCAGASFNELIAIEDAETGEQFFSGFAKVINTMRKCPKLIVGRVQGKTVGGGVGLAAATDYCFATQFASVKLSELSIGIGPFVIEPAVSRRIGLNAMSHMTLNAETFFTSEWAKTNGLFAEVFDDISALDKAVENFAEKLASYNPEALQQMKKVLWEHTENWDTLLAERAKISGRLVLSKFTKDTLQRFK